MRAEDDRQDPSENRGPSRVSAGAPARSLPDGPGHEPAKPPPATTTIVQLRVPRRKPEPPAADTVRATLAELRRDVEALEAVVATWDERERNTVAALERALDALHKEALTRMIRALEASPAAATALREAAADEVVYAVLRHHDILRPSLQERVEAALASVRPQLRRARPERARQLRGSVGARARRLRDEPHRRRRSAENPRLTGGARRGPSRDRRHGTRR